MAPVSGIEPVSESAPVKLEGVPNNSLTSALVDTAVPPNISDRSTLGLVVLLVVPLDDEEVPIPNTLAASSSI